MRILLGGSYGCEAETIMETKLWPVIECAAGVLPVTRNKKYCHPNRMKLHHYSWVSFGTAKFATIVHDCTNISSTLLFYDFFDLFSSFICVTEFSKNLNTFMDFYSIFSVLQFYGFVFNLSDPFVLFSCFQSFQSFVCSMIFAAPFGSFMDRSVLQPQKKKTSNSFPKDISEMGWHGTWVLHR